MRIRGARKQQKRQKRAGSAGRCSRAWLAIRQLPQREATALAGPDLRRPIVGRGLAIGDYDNDGRVDVLATNLEGAPLLLHNEAPATDRWLRVRLAPAPGHTAEGAEVVVTAGGRRWYRWATTGGSYLSASDPRVYVGLGPVAMVDRIELRWPDGMRQTVVHPPIDQELRLKEARR